MVASQESVREAGRLTSALVAPHSRTIAAWAAGLGQHALRRRAIARYEGRGMTKAVARTRRPPPPECLHSVAVLFEVAGGAEPPHCVDLDHNRDALLLGVLLTLRLDDRVVDLVV